MNNPPLLNISDFLTFQIASMKEPLPEWIIIWLYSPKIALSVLVETNVVSLFSKTLTAQVYSVFSD